MTEATPRRYTRDDYEQEWIAQIDDAAPALDWDGFLDVFEWEQSQHIGIIGPTGSGKTNLSMYLLSLRDYIVALATKPYDETIDNLIKTGGYAKWEKWYDRPAEYLPDGGVIGWPKRVIWPDAKDLFSQKKQRDIFKDALSDIYRGGNWCVFIDEMWYLIHQLKMEKEVKTYLLQARSNGISLVGASQRPAWIPIEMFDQPEHLFFYRDNDERNLKTISGISWLSANLVRAAVARLEQYQFLYIHTRSGRMFRSIAPPPEGGE